jgi:hypothetical protein
MMKKETGGLDLTLLATSIICHRNRPIHEAAYRVFSDCTWDKYIRYLRCHLSRHGIGGQCGLRANPLCLCLALLYNNNILIFVSSVGLLTDVSYTRPLPLFYAPFVFGNGHDTSSCHVQSVGNFYAMFAHLPYEKHYMLSLICSSVLCEHGDNRCSAYFFSLYFADNTFCRTLPCVLCVFPCTSSSFLLSLLCLLYANSFCIQADALCVLHNTAFFVRLIALCLLCDTFADRLLRSPCILDAILPYCVWGKTRQLQDKSLGIWSISLRWGCPHGQKMVRCSRCISLLDVSTSLGCSTIAGDNQYSFTSSLYRKTAPKATSPPYFADFESILMRT